MAAGRAKRERQDLRGALESFRAADAIMHVPPTGVEVAITLAQFGLYVEAGNAASAVRALPVNGEEPAQFQTARNAALQLLQTLKERTPTLRVVVTGLAAGTAATVTLDDAPVEAAALTDGIILNPGHHALVARSGEAEVKRALDLSEGEHKELLLEMPQPAAEPADKRASDNPAPSSDSSSVSPVVYVGVGGALLGVGTGIALIAVAKSNENQLATTCAPNCTAEGILQVSSLYSASNVAFIAGGASAAVAAIWYLLIPNRQTSHSWAEGAPVKVSPTFATDLRGAQLGLRGTF